jgi:NAD(P)-dependent dehydrogenase (short-subunit alcohol dehydrogenase family)
MLQLDMDVEADLGIDSIKRVEILSTLEEKMPDLPKISPDQMGTLKTLGQILAYLTTPDKTIVPVAAAAAPQSEASTEMRVSRSEDTPGPVASLERSLVGLLPAPPLPEKAANTLEGQRIYLLGNPAGLTTALAQQLSDRGMLTSLVSPHEVQTLCRQGSNGLEQAAGLIIVAPHNGSPDTLGAGTALEFIESCFQLAQGLARRLMASAQRCGALLATVTRLDGAFGFRRPENINPLFAGLAGLPKTAAHEWPGVVCRAVDVDPEWGDIESIADAVATELMQANADGPIEVGLDPHARLTPMVTASPYPSTPTVDPGLGPEDVVVVSGGARGVTAAAAIKLAQATQSVMVLLGRSAAPQPEPPWLEAMKDEAAMKKAILDHDFEGQTPSPKDLQARFRHYLTGREIQTTLQHIQQAGATAVYYQTDVRNADAVQEVLSEVRGTYGKITTIIHGAGVLEDRLIVDKTPQQFTRVVDTKVQGLQSLLAATRQDTLRHIILFSSVSARYGNQGQVDYAIANEILNKVAQQEAAARPDCRVVAINWGPWDGGMVTPTVKREFARRQIDLLPIDMGAAAMVHEMALPPGSPAEVIVGSPLRPIEAAPETDAIDPAELPLTSPAPGHGLALTFKRELDLESHPVLAAHQLNGQAVVPFALIAEWFGHGALHANPGLMLHGIDDMRLLQGIKIANDPRTIRVLAGKMQKKGSFFNVDVELRDGFKNNIDVVHSRAQAVLTDIDFPAPDRFTRPGDITVSPYPRTVEEIYEQILFHGDSLKGLRRIIGSSAQGMIAEIASAPDPAQWMENPLRSQWIIDPLALDSAFQMACVWCYDNAGAVSLPSYCGSYRQYRSRFPADGMIAVLKITSVREHKMRGDVTFLDHQEACVAQILNYEAVIDVSLNRAFKPQNSAA